MAGRSIGRSGELRIDNAALGALLLSGLGRNRNSGILVLGQIDHDVLIAPIPYPSRSVLVSREHARPT
jgi:hypothetical protein